MSTRDVKRQYERAIPKSYESEDAQMTIAKTLSSALSHFFLEKVKIFIRFNTQVLINGRLRLFHWIYLR
ncbi:hypothetical protein MPTK1_8g01640 [Marchantia polymorpha subsp. ruderalis]|uniref:Uncharacterized protein n=1 Tax=Marchantia polymorpha TaxID=3197 RepID=A0A2R6WR54_MARPO|nr:hypothetical protein MARPO_0064s0035 [Marchantia polymorpha]BBN18324.1 hypothetical protein Mp_8g01640 [Marchantia polymorpha subsp. ruderalis]|eukprot:PTQ36348.1 hypothetical protein MARPO_0064s0035 [Marchantia polymorpha]